MSARAPGGALAPLAPLALLVAIFGATPSCISTESRLTGTVERYLTAIVRRDSEGMALVWGPFRRDAGAGNSEGYGKRLVAFEGRYQAGQRAFDMAKKEGSLAPDPFGVAMFRALGLGKGAASFPIATEVTGEGATARVRTRVVTNLETLHLDSLPDGVRVYLPGFPLGRLEMISVGFDELANHRLLESVDVEWILSRATEAVPSPTGWLIESIAADPNSSVEWKPKAKRG
ncbi:MAG TPA: hypothetical protein VE404_09005 [Verrucomicrobiae bacterium]|nr:hypothetical protein [Verrucomicrobiae bacterium]